MLLPFFGGWVFGEGGFGKGGVREGMDGLRERERVRGEERGGGVRIYGC